MNAKSAEWQAKQEEIKEAGNAKRSGKAKGNDNAAKERTENSSRTNGTTTEKDKDKTRKAKAKASNTNQGAVAKMDLLKNERPDLAEKVKKGDNDMEFWIAEIKVRAARRIGEITRELDKTHGNRYVESAPDAPSKKEVLKQAGISKEEASRCERIASLVRRTKQNPHGKLPSTGKFKTEVLKKAGISTQDAGLAKLAASLKQQITKDLDQYFPALGSTRVKH